jgi:hypothetical protein
VTRRWLILNVVLGVIVLGLGVQIVRTWARALPPVEPRAAGKLADVPSRGEGGKRSKRAQADRAPQTPATMVAVIVNKDLFDPSRTRPSEETKVQTVAHEPPPPGISLVGVRAVGKDREGFILDATQANTQRRVRAGDTIGNFTVKSIRSSSIVLVSPANDLVTLSLEVDKSKNAVTPPARPGRPQAANAAAGSQSPAAGVSGTSPAAGVGSGAKPPVTAAGTAAAPHPPAPGAPAVQAPGTPPTTIPPKRPPSPNLPEGVRQKLEQMRGLNKR